MAEANSRPVRTTKEHPFFSCSVHQDPLFLINSGVKFEDALSQASCFLSSALKISEDAAFECDTAQAWASCYLIEISKAIVDSALKACELEARNGK
ncbi:MAG: DUF3077 domain-containing protein [Hydrogenophaga sp.]|nr:DUF3077 domain-containing protein [Hydrogenophaga sp.]